MRKVILSLAAAGAAIVAASPVAAQYSPGPQGYGYGGGYNGSGINAIGQVRMLQGRIDRIEWQINRLDRRNIVRDGTADRLREESTRVERRLRMAARNGGLNPYEFNDIQNRIGRLEQRVQYAVARNPRGYEGYGGYQAYNGYGFNGDRDERHEREHERWNDREDD